MEMDLQEPRVDTELGLPDGRRLAYAEYGDPDGVPVFFFPGTPGSRYFHVPDETAASLGARVVTVDQPGYGRSTLDRSLGLLNWPADAAALADELGVERFAVTGHSGGGAFALACAVRIPDRTRSVATMAGIAPFYRPEVRERMSEGDREIGGLVDGNEPLESLAEGAFGEAHAKPAAAFEGLLAAAPPADTVVLERDAVREMMVRNLREAFRQGTAVWAHESELFFSPWGFDLAEVPVHVNVWQGDQDPLVPPFMGEYLVDYLPAATLHRREDDGHTVFVTAWESVLSTLVGGS